MSKSKVDIADMLASAKASQTYLKVCAPMVRYSKVQFRTLVKKLVYIFIFYSVCF